MIGRGLVWIVLARTIFFTLIYLKTNLLEAQWILWIFMQFMLIHIYRFYWDFYGRRLFCIAQILIRLTHNQTNFKGLINHIYQDIIFIAFEIFLNAVMQFRHTTFYTIDTLYFLPNILISTVGCMKLRKFSWKQNPGWNYTVKNPHKNG